MALFEPPRPLTREEILGSDAATRALSVTVVENDFVARVYETIAWFYDLSGVQDSRPGVEPRRDESPILGEDRVPREQFDLRHAGPFHSLVQPCAPIRWRERSVLASLFVHVEKLNMLIQQSSKLVRSENRRDRVAVDDDQLLAADEAVLCRDQAIGDAP